MFRSIRGSLLVWYSLILLAVLVGFGGVLYARVRRATFVEIDAELAGSGQALAASLREGPWPLGGVPPGFFRWGGRGMGFGGGVGGIGPRGPFGMRGIERRLDPPEARGSEPPDGNDGRGSRLEGDRTPGSQDLVPIPQAVLRRFGEGPDDGPYFVIWSAEGVVIEASDGAPELTFPGIPQGSRAEPGSVVFRDRGTRREAVVTGTRGRQVLVGLSIERERERLRNLAWTLVVTGSGVLAVGLLGGWLLAGRVIRPIASIAATAERISASNLSQRIDTVGTSRELGRLARVLNAMFARLEAAFDRQVRFTADASHELRTPLAVIQAHAELALARERSPEEYREAIATCLKSAHRMNMLVNDLLTLARADAGNLELRRIPFDLGLAAAETITQMEPLAEERGITLEFANAAESPLGIVGDSSRIAQVISNLVTNAILYNRPGGTVRVSVRSEGPWAVLEVADTGIGIPEADLPHVFERFYRVDRARSRVHGGTGLGLAICKGMVEAHGGTIELTSHPGSGTVATVRLPASAAKSARQDIASLVAARTATRSVT